MSYSTFSDNDCFVVGVHNTEYFVDDPNICAPESPKISNSSADSKMVPKVSLRKMDVDGNRPSNVDPNTPLRRSSVAGPRNGRLQVRAPPIFSQLFR